MSDSVIFLVEMFGGTTKLRSVILGALTVFLTLVVICLVVKIKQLQKGDCSFVVFFTSYFFFKLCI